MTSRDPQRRVSCVWGSGSCKGVSRNAWLEGTPYCGESTSAAAGVRCSDSVSVPIDELGVEGGREGGAALASSDTRVSSFRPLSPCLFRNRVKLRQAGAEADLHVYEGMSHGDYVKELAAPESQHFLLQVDQFLIRHLRASPRTRTTEVPRMESSKWT